MSAPEELMRIITDNVERPRELLRGGGGMLSRRDWCCISECFHFERKMQKPFTDYTDEEIHQYADCFYVSDFDVVVNKPYFPTGDDWRRHFTELRPKSKSSSKITEVENKSVEIKEDSSYRYLNAKSLAGDRRTVQIDVKSPIIDSQWLNTFLVSRAVSSQSFGLPDGVELNKVMGDWTPTRVETEIVFDRPVKLLFETKMAVFKNKTTTAQALLTVLESWRTVFVNFTPITIDEEGFFIIRVTKHYFHDQVFPEFAAKTMKPDDDLL